MSPLSLLRAEAVRLLTRRLSWLVVLVLLGVSAATLVAVATARGNAAASVSLTEQPGVLLYIYAALVSFWMGASWVGDELTSGGMACLLLWRSGRSAVLGAKLAVLLGWLLLLAVAISALFLAAAPAASDPGAGGFAGQVWMCVRGTLLALVAGAIGFAGATVGGSTVAALGTLAGYLMVWELGGRVVPEMSTRDEWFLVSHLLAWLQAGVTPDGGTVTAAVTWPQAGAVLAALVAIALGGAFATFARRDLA